MSSIRMETSKDMKAEGIWIVGPATKNNHPMHVMDSADGVDNDSLERQLAEMNVWKQLAQWRQIVQRLSPGNCTRYRLRERNKDLKLRYLAGMIVCKQLAWYRQVVQRFSPGNWTRWLMPSSTSREYWSYFSVAWPGRNSGYGVTIGDVRMERRPRTSAWIHYPEVLFLLLDLPCGSWVLVGRRNHENETSEHVTQNIRSSFWLLKWCFGFEIRLNRQDRI